MIINSNILTKLEIKRIVITNSANTFCQIGGTMSDNKDTERFASSLEENLKKALTELLVLKLLSRREYYIGELTEEISRKTDHALTIVFPYGAIYRMTGSEYITESKKQNAPDGRLRQYYKITNKGRKYLKQLEQGYADFQIAVSKILQDEPEK